MTDNIKICDLAIHRLYRFIKKENNIQYIGARLDYKSKYKKTVMARDVYLLSNSKAKKTTLASVMLKYKTINYQKEISLFIDYINRLKLVKEEEFIEACLVAELLSAIGEKTYLQNEYFIKEEKNNVELMYKYTDKINDVISVSIYDKKIPKIDELYGMQYVLLNFKKYWKKYKEIKQRIIDNKKDEVINSEDNQYKFIDIKNS